MTLKHFIASMPISGIIAACLTVFILCGNFRPSSIFLSPFHPHSLFLLLLLSLPFSSSPSLPLPHPPFLLLSLSPSFPSQEVNDAARNDREESIPPEVMSQLKEMGGFGLQVPPDMEGVGLINTQAARMMEIIGAYDLGIGIALGAHQVRDYVVRERTFFATGAPLK